ncbi:MAG TPA: hypothetical protein VIH21_09505, partial [Dehalococcoidia bacterium]
RRCRCRSLRSEKRIKVGLEKRGCRRHGIRVFRAPIAATIARTLRLEVTAKTPPILASPP